MSNTKQAKPKRLLSLFLVLTMVLGMLPAMSLTASAAVVTDVNFTVRAPIGTEHPSNTATCDNEKVRVTDVQWTKGDTGTGKVLGEDDEFKAGDWYTVKVYFYCTDNYTVAVNYTATLNGNAVSLENADGMPGIYVTEYAFQAKDSLFAYLPDDVYWTIWGNVTASGETGYNQLKEYIQKETVTWAIRLDSDVKYTEDYKLGMTVTGKKYLDLNGHDIDIKYDKGWTDTLFTIPEGSELVILDSKGGGSIRYDGYIFDGADYDAGHLAVRHVFDVSGKLTINGGRILGGGRSKQQWLAVASKGGKVEVYGFNGYVRNQVNGCGVIVENGGELVVNGGDVTGRGYEYLTSGDEENLPSYKRAAAIRIMSGAKVTLNDGYFKGYGGADVIDLRAYANQVNVTVKAGQFVTHKIDKVRLPDAIITDQWMGGQRDNYMDGTYGVVGLKSEWIDPNAEVIIGGEEAETNEDGVIQVHDYNNATHIISPKENMLPVDFCNTTICHNGFGTTTSPSEKLFYMGTEAQAGGLTGVIYYSESETECKKENYHGETNYSGQYWHYDENGNPVIWGNESFDSAYRLLYGTAGTSDSEGPAKVIDSSTSTKWCLNFNSSTGAYVAFALEEAKAISGYTFTTANDTASNTGRNPKSWVIYGSNDTACESESYTGWTEICRVTDDTTMEGVNFTDYSFAVDGNTTAYQYYKIVFTANGGDGCLQLSEISLY